MRTQMVRIAQADHTVLSEMAQATGRPMTEILSEAIRELQRSQLLRQTNDAYARLKNDPEAWKEETEDRLMWENTLADGLE